MATFNVLLQAIDICRRAKITLFIWGHRGLGKSSVVRQYTKLNQIGFIDLRCSQLEYSDIRGLPDAVEGCTRYLPPADLPVGGLKHEQVLTKLAQSQDLTIHQLQREYDQGLLFLDEVNRAQDDVIQAIFQLVYDGVVGQYVLPPGWATVCAGNFIEGYLTNGFNDPAFLDRFCHITLSSGESTLNEWIDYMVDTYGQDASQIIEFASHNIEHLDGKIKGELGFSIQPSRRSWEMIQKVQLVTRERSYSAEAVLEVYAGLIGRDLALSFTRYSCPVKPIDLLQQGVEPLTVALDKLQRNQLTGLIWGMVALCKNQITDVKVSDVCVGFAKYIIKREKDLAVAFCRALINDHNISEGIKSASISNPGLAKLITKFNDKAGKPASFIDKLNQSPELQKALSNICW